MAIQTADAHAGFSYFCPPASSYSIQIIEANSYCLSGQFQSLTQVELITTDSQGSALSGVSHCAGAHASGAGGAVVIAFVCTTAPFAQSACYTPRQGYAKGVSQSPNRHYFHGNTAWGSGSCL
jgi:hypothetical protein